MASVRRTRILRVLIGVVVFAGCGRDGSQGDRADAGEDATVCQYRTLPSGLTTLPSFTFNVIHPDGNVLSCSTRFPVDGAISGSWPSPVTSVISGRVTAVVDSELSVDTCQPGADCMPTVYRFAIEAPGLSVTVPLGRKVTVGWWINVGPWSCARALVVSDGASTDAGAATPAPLWLAGADSLVSPQLPLPFSVAQQELFCNPNPSLGQGCGGNVVPPDDYAFQFTPQSADPPLSVATGQTGTLVLTVGANAVQHLTVRSLRSYQTQMCDDYGNWAWWAMGRADPSGEPE